MRRGLVACSLHLVAVAVVAQAAPPTERLIVDPALRARVDAQLSAQRKLAARRAGAVFGVLDQAQAGPEREALEFLLAFSPLGDLADYDGEYFLRVVRSTLATRDAMPWGARIPSDLFLRYVLPPRVNTENLDGARWVLHQQLAQRVRGLTLEAAVLEVNHFCHEHVTYRPSDMRTSAPLATMCTTWGRCGEESTLTVSALRAVGIPARQVYTPRWAHVDDNHAWVEVWVDGRWHYLGACEPEPRLDVAWFSEPVRRAMLVHTKVFGGGLASDEKVRSTPWFDEINLIASYAPTALRRVKVVDAKGAAVSGALVDFGLYNYAELYPLVTRTSGQDGVVTLTTGKGDLRIWASKGDLAGVATARPGDAETIVTLAPIVTTERSEDIDLHPPVEPLPAPAAVEPVVRAANAERFAREDALRNAKMETFPHVAQGELLGAELGLDPKAVGRVLAKSFGNHEAIVTFLRQTPPAQRQWALALLGTISDKDLRDTPVEVLRNHLDAAFRTAGDLPQQDREVFVEGVLAPRVAHELLRPWRGYLQGALAGALATTAQPSVDAIREWVRTHVTVDEAANYYSVPISPRGVFELRVADPLSRDILFVALCRAAGYPARLEPAGRAPQVRSAAGWRTVSFAPGAPPAGAPALLTLAGQGDDLEYGVHFALARLNDGRWTTLDFEGKHMAAFAAPTAVEPGLYQLTTGTRLDSGSVLVRQRWFALKPGERKAVTVEMRPVPASVTVLGRAPAALAVASVDGTPRDLTATLAPRGLLLAWIDAGSEPTVHALGDLVRMRSVLGAWSGGVVLALERAPAGGATPTGELDLPDQTTIVLDRDGALRTRLAQAIGRSSAATLPVIVVINPLGEVVFHSAGYRIGVAEQLLKVIRHLERRFPMPLSEG